MKHEDDTKIDLREICRIAFAFTIQLAVDFPEDDSETETVTQTNHPSLRSLANIWMLGSQTL